MKETNDSRFPLHDNINLKYRYDCVLNKCVYLADPFPSLRSCVIFVLFAVMLVQKLPTVYRITTNGLEDIFVLRKGTFVVIKKIGPGWPPSF